MDSIFLLLTTGFLVGAVGTLIGAGGGFILIPLLIFVHPGFSSEITTGISIAVVAGNAISGSIAYARSGRIDYKAGLLFAAFTIPGSILGVYSTQFIPKTIFNISFGVLLVMLALFLFIKRSTVSPVSDDIIPRKAWKRHSLTDSEGTRYEYAYNQNKGILISLVVGYLSPLLGIGGGIIHVPALVSWLRFPVFVATATSHFILAIMASVSVLVHLLNGNYNDPQVLHIVIGLCIGAIAGAQLGAFLSHRMRGRVVIRALAVCLGIVGIRILLSVL
jgi:uncharacterized protein